MAAVSLFWGTNMAAVTSCENTLLKPLKPRSIEPRHLTGPFNNRGFRETGPGHKGPVIIYRLRGVRGRITSFIAERKGRSFVTENPKGGIAENFARIQRGGGTTHICLENEDMEGIAKVIKSYEGG